jgi:hypothetical protein
LLNKERNGFRRGRYCRQYIYHTTTAGKRKNIVSKTKEMALTGKMNVGTKIVLNMNK